MTIKEETLIKALKEAGLSSLPKPLSLSDSKTWIKAIVLVKKTNIESYCIAVNDGSGKPVFTHDFGPCMIITSVLSIYPISVLDSKYTPDLRSDKQIIQYLSKNGYDQNLITAMLDKSAHATPEDAKRDRDKVKMYVTQAALEYAKREQEERKRCAAIRNYKKK